MNIPESCRLGKRIYKKLFQENIKLSSTDNKALQDDVDTIYWQYTFKPTTIPIQAYVDDQREYLEIALLQVNLKQIGRVKRLAEIIHRAIPYPLLVFFVYETSFTLSLANKRFSQAEQDAIVADDFQMTDWIDMSHSTEIQGAFLNSLDLSTWPHTHFYAFYKAAVDRVITLACAGQTGFYSLDLPNDYSVDERIVKLDQIEKLQQEKSELVGKLKKEKNLGTKVQLNTQIRQIKNQLDLLRTNL